MKIYLDNQGSQFVAHFLDRESQEWAETALDFYQAGGKILLPQFVDEFRNNFVDAGGSFL